MIRTLSIAAVALTLAACATTQAYPPQIQSKLGRVSDRVHIAEIKEQALPDGTLEIAVFAESAVRFEQKIQYRVNWFDGAGMPIKTAVDTPVQRSLDKRQAFNFTATGPGPRATHYTIDIQAEGE